MIMYWCILLVSSGVTLWFSASDATLRNKGELFTLKWRYKERDGVSNHRHLDCLLNRLYRFRSKKTSKLPVHGFCEGKSPVSPMTGEFSAQRDSNAENVSIWWHYHDMIPSKPQKNKTHENPLHISPGAKMGTWKSVRVQGFMIDTESIGVLKDIKLGCHDGNLGELFLFA